MDFEYYFFDLDGTLTDPALGITNSFIYALNYFGIEIPSYEKLCSFIGPPLPLTFKNEFSFDDEKTALAVKKYREYFSTKGLFENSVYEGIENILRKLYQNGKKIILATSKPEVFAIKILEHFDLAKYFEHICGCNLDESRSEKAEVIAYAIDLAKIKDKSKILMIGDRQHDVIGARKNGIKSCGILFGYGSKKELEESGADFILQSVQELEDFLT